MRCFLFITLLISAALTACTKRHVGASVGTPPPYSGPANTLVEDTLIQSTGTWHYTERDLTRILTASTGAAGTIDWKFQYAGPRGSGSMSSSITRTSPADPWFIYVESPGKLWFFDGTRMLTYRSWEGHDDAGDAIIDGKLKVNATDIPSELIQHLPDDLRKLFPDGGSKPRPSI